MIRADIERALRNQTSGDFLNRREVAMALGYKDPHSVDKYLKGLGRIGNRYLIRDVAERVMEETNVGRERILRI